MKETALKRLFSVRKVLVYSKVWAQRTMSWMAVLNSAMILFLVIAKLQDYGIKISLVRWFIPIFVLLVGLLVFFGYLEDKAGFHREELNEITKRNPVYGEILERLERIENKLHDAKVKRP